MKSALKDSQLLLAEDIVSICAAKRSTDAPCRITFSLARPNPIWIEVNADVHMEVGEVASLTFRDANVMFDGFLMSASTSPAMAWFVPHLSGPVSVGTPETLAKVDLYLINFKAFLTTNLAGELRRNTIEMCGGGWRFCIRPLRGGLTNMERYKAGSPLQRFTHSATLEREDSSPFSSAQCRRALDAFHVFLSFVNGQWTTFVLVEGTTENGSIVWREWGNRWIQDLAEVNESWLEPLHGNALAEALPGFFDVWERWEDVIHTSIYWYIVSNRLGAGADGGLVLTQAALEGLSKAVLAGSQSAPSKGKKATAAVKIRRLLTKLTIPLTIPSSLEQLSTVFHGKDGPDAVVSIRNEITHSYASSNSLPVMEAWQLAQWYLELSLLRLFCFNGSYSNRTRSGNKYHGQVDLVPWKSSAT